MEIPLSKKEIRDQERQRQMEAADRAVRNAKLKRIGMWTAVVVALGGMVWGLAQLGASGPIVAGGKLADAVTANDWMKGNPMATLTLVEYADFQCPACGAFYPYLKNITQKYGAQIQIVFRHYPLPQHTFAELAARAAEAAGKQGKFWEMHDLLFEGQATWSRASDATPIFVSYAENLKLNVDQFKRDLDSSEIKKKISDSTDSGIRSSVNATPTFFLNGDMIANLNSYADLEQLIADRLAGK